MAVEVQELEPRRQWDERFGNTTVRVFRGMKRDIEALWGRVRNQEGVLRADVRPDDDSPLADLEVSFSNDQSGTGESDLTQQWELTFQTIQRRILGNPNAKKIPADEVNAVKEAIETNQRDFDTSGLTSEAQDLYDLLLRGNDSYLDWRPVLREVRIVETTALLPDFWFQHIGSAVDYTWLLNNEGLDFNIRFSLSQLQTLAPTSGWWLKIPPEVVQTGRRKWQATREFQFADEVAFLYPQIQG